MPRKKVTKVQRLIELREELFITTHNMQRSLLTIGTDAHNWTEEQVGQVYQAMLTIHPLIESLDGRLEDIVKLDQLITNLNEDKP